MLFGLSPNRLCRSGRHGLHHSTQEPLLRRRLRRHSIPPPGENAAAGILPDTVGSTPKRSLARLDAIGEAEENVVATQLTFGRYLTERFMPMRRQRLQSTTAYRYEWMIEHYINPVLGSMPLRSVRCGAPRPPLRRPSRHRRREEVRSRTQDRLRRPRRYPLGVHPSRTPAPRRGEPRARRTAATFSATPAQRPGVLDRRTARRVPRRHAASAATSGVAPRGVHRHASRRTRRAPVGRLAPCHPSALDRQKPPGRRRPLCRRRGQDPHEPTLHRPRRRHRTSTPSVAQTPASETATRSVPTIRSSPTRPDIPVHPESIYQLFHRQVRRLDMPRICFHGLRHTHASLLVAAGTPIKVVSERLGHANPGFTMATYQHVMPGMGAEAADKFSQLLAASR